MIFGLFTLLVAITISCVAAYYSIVGLTAIFSAAVLPIIIMGASLEVGKVTAAVWLKLNWQRANLTYKLYLVPAVALLMLLTSMGIFGFLSKAHSDQILVTGDVGARLVLIEEKIKIERDNIDNARAVIKQLDDAVNGINAKGSEREIKLRDGSTYTRSAAELALQVRRSQAKDRDRLTKEIEVAQTKILKLQEEAAPIRAETRKVEAEVGPIKYIAALIYGDNPDADLLERAVRWVIIIIVAVFDPLALVLILAAQQSLRWYKEDKEQDTPDPYIADVGEKPTAEELKEIDEIVEEKDLFDEVKITPETHPYLYKSFAHFENLKPMVYKPEVQEEPAIEAEVSTQQPEPEPVVEEPKQPDIQTQVAGVRRVGTDYFGYQGKMMHEAVFKKQHPLLYKAIMEPATLQADNAETRATVSGFGTQFPNQSVKGDMFLRVDQTPNKLFKFNGAKWIEVDKERTDSYTYDKQYIVFLIEKLKSGEYELDQLSATEQELVAEELKQQENNGKA